MKKNKQELGYLRILSKIKDFIGTHYPKTEAKYLEEIEQELLNLDINFKLVKRVLPMDLKELKLKGINLSNASFLIEYEVNRKLKIKNTTLFLWLKKPSNKWLSTYNVSKKEYFQVTKEAKERPKQLRK